MNILIIGAGGRENAIARALKRSKHQPHIWAIGAHINFGIATIANMIKLDINDPDKILQFAQKQKIHMAIIGSENQLALGVVDVLTEAGIFCLGPFKNQARLETNKIFTRELLTKIKPEVNPKYIQVTKKNYTPDIFTKFGGEYVIKAVGLCGGKGVKVSGIQLHSIKDARTYAEELLARDGRFLLEEKLIGQEFSLMAFTDGKTLKSMPIVQDYKCRDVNNKSVHTGGMGCISHSNHRQPFLTPADIAATEAINQAVIDATPGYSGILYGGFMKTASGIKVIEYNCRGGDPEIINVLELLETDFVDILLAIKDKKLAELDIKYVAQAMVTHYLVEPTYPERLTENSFMWVPDSPNIIYGKVKKHPDYPSNMFIQMGSRSIAVFSKADTLQEAYQKNQKLISCVGGNFHFREDIGFQPIC